MFHAIISLRIALRAASSPLCNNSAVFLQHRNKCNFWYFVGFTVIFIVIFQSVSSFSVFSLIQIVIGFHSFFFVCGHHILSRKPLNNCCPSKGYFDSSAIKTFVQLPSIDGSLRRNHIAALNIAYMLSPHYYSLC